MKNILITGAAGFIGSNFIKFLLGKEDVFIVNLDALTYAGNLENLSEIEHLPNYKFVHGSIQNIELVRFLCDKYDIEGIINFAAESHVDRSILDAQPFIETNVAGTLALLQVALDKKIKRYLQVSTDEVYGSLGTDGFFTELTPLSPNSPYSASKAAADHLVMAYYHTYGLPTLITRCSNNYGPYQFPEKLIPLMILNAINDKPLPVYGDGLNVRDWIHVDDHCSGIWTVFNKGQIGDVYNIGGRNEWTNIDIVKTILKILNKPESLIKYVPDRLGHDRRYAIDCSKIENELGWKNHISFEQGLKATVDWYISHPAWCNNLLTGAYKEYYKLNYKML